ncbi:MAG: hypothetical protein JXR65_02395 [Bacteroidales bacterium]|nr:hypothetical protein [Bacteroidales bacterium]
MRTNQTYEFRFFPGYYSKPGNYQNNENKRRVLTACHPSVWSWLNSKTLFTH